MEPNIDAGAQAAFPDALLSQGGLHAAMKALLGTSAYQTGQGAHPSCSSSETAAMQHTTGYYQTALHANILLQPDTLAFSKQSFS